ncbi:ankyrin repeat-containing domain protein, partial [Baffinella frigidus]
MLRTRCAARGALLLLSLTCSSPCQSTPPAALDLPAALYPRLLAFKPRPRACVPLRGGGGGECAVCFLPFATVCSVSGGASSTATRRQGGAANQGGATRPIPRPVFTGIRGGGGSSPELLIAGNPGMPGDDAGASGGGVAEGGAGTAMDIGSGGGEEGDLDEMIVEDEEEDEESGGEGDEEEEEGASHADSEERKRRVALEAAKPRGPPPPAWPGPYVPHWGQADPGEPNRYGGAEEVLGRRLCGAAERGDAGECSALLENGADCNYRDLVQDERSPLHQAAAYKHLHIAQLLLAAGALVDAAARDGTTPLMLAAAVGERPLVQALVDAGADVNRTNSKGNTALHKAAALNEFRQVKALLALGADIHAANIDGDTPLHQAAILGSVYAARALVNAGADLDRRNAQGSSPVREAKVYGHEFLLQFLSKKTQDTSWDLPFDGPTWHAYKSFVDRPAHVREREQQMLRCMPTSAAFWR